MISEYLVENAFAVLGDHAFGLVEHAVFGEKLADGGSSAPGIVLTEDVMKIVCQQRRYAV